MLQGASSAESRTSLRPCAIDDPMLDQQILAVSPPAARPDTLRRSWEFHISRAPVQNVKFRHAVTYFWQRHSVEHALAFRIHARCVCAPECMPSAACQLCGL